jgi:hypothetical protein
MDESDNVDNMNKDVTTLHMNMRMKTWIHFNDVNATHNEAGIES